MVSNPQTSEAGSTGWKIRAGLKKAAGFPSGRGVDRALNERGGLTPLQRDHPPRGTKVDIFDPPQTKPPES